MTPKRDRPAEKTKLHPSSLGRLLPWLKPHILLLLLIFFLVLIINGADLLKPYILRIVIDDYLKSGLGAVDDAPITWLGLAYLICVLASSSLHYFQAILVTRLGQTILMNIRRDVFSHILHLPMRILDHYSSGRLITRATNDVETLNEFFSDVLINLFRDVFLLIGIIS
ncbi:MAG TPA: ABC transporter ATP-binding protein, partial [Clostridiales bacterium]|nr:ABC transporter ATP-binding protein [Clostridiales bacterium]